jgi:hypothetical protein
MRPRVAHVKRSLRWARRATIGGLVAAVAGLVIVLGQSLSDALANPGWTLSDGYWLGRLPWMAVGVNLAIVGATIAAVSGALAAWLAGGGVRRIVSGAALLVAGFWWFVAMLPPPQGAYCETCPPPGPDPLTMAYAMPEAAGLFLLLTSLVIVAVALLRAQIRASLAGS